MRRVHKSGHRFKLSELKIRQVRREFKRTQISHLPAAFALDLERKRKLNNDGLKFVANKLRSKKNAKDEVLLSEKAYREERQGVLNTASETGTYEDPNPFVKPGGYIE